MSKVLVSPNSIKLIEKSINLVDGIVIGIKDYSVNYCSFSLDEVFKIIDICNKNNKEIFVVLNKNIHNNELDKVKEILTKLNNINGLFYYDNSILYLKKELNLKYDLVFDQEHQSTNYLTINNYYDLGVNYTHLSTDITLREMKDGEIEARIPLYNVRRGLVMVIDVYKDSYVYDDKDSYVYFSIYGEYLRY